MKHKNKHEKIERATRIKAVSQSPTGIFAGEVCSYGITTTMLDNEPSRIITLNFRIAGPGGNDNIVRVYSDYDADLEEGCKLRQLLSVWLGESFVKNHLKNGLFDWGALVRQRADLMLSLFLCPSCGEQEVSIDAIFAPGTLIQTETIKN